ncbi:MAG: hypothetical protein HY550_10110 [Elusimicrobia bacterium]|nr:hypothetical protein [Elusimicrobiota bacterium]
MKYILAAALLVPACAVLAQENAAKRLTGLEKRVTKVEKRVTRLEGGAALPAAAGKRAEAARPKGSAAPIAVYFRKKKQVLGQAKLGIKLYLEFENLTARRYNAFSGTLVFKNETGTVIWSRPYGHGEPLGPGERVEVTMGILSDQPKEYLKFVKARDVTVSLEKQEFYSAD